MKQQIVIGGLFLALAFGAAVALSQETEKPLTPKESASPAVKGLIDQLGDESFPVRQRAEQRLLALGEKAAAELERAAKEHPDEHVRYEAERLLSRIRGSGNDAAGPPRQKLDDDYRRLEDGMNGLLKELEESGLLDEEQLARLRDLMKRPEGLMPAPGGAFGRSMGGEFHGSIDTGDRRVEVNRDADGHVKVDVTENGETKTYEADSMEALKKEHPEIHDLVAKHFLFLDGQNGFFGRFHFGPFGRGGPPMPGLPGGLRGPSTPGERPLTEKGGELPPDGFRLGVWIGQMTDPLRYQLDLADGVGLLVESIVPGSLADRIGMQRFDVLVSVNGEKVGEPGAVRTILGDVPEGGKVTLEVIRKGKTMSLIGTR